MTPATEQRIRAAFSTLADELIDAFDADVEGGAPDRLYSIPEAAEFLGGVARSTIYRELQAGHLRSIRVGSRRLVPSSAIAEYIAERGS